MTMETLGYLSEFISAVAVLVTLIYLSIQVRHVKEQGMIAARQTRAAAARELLLSISDSPHLASIFAPWVGEFAGAQGFEQAKPADAIRLASWCHGWMRTEENSFKSRLPAEERKTQDQLLMYWLATPWGATFWENTKAIYDADFAAYMDEIHLKVKESSKSADDLLVMR